MARLGNISGKDAIKAFQKAGWGVIGQFGSLIRNAGLSLDEFLNLL